MIEMHTYVPYEEELQTLRAHLTKMGEQVRGMLRQSLGALTRADRALAREAIAEDPIVNRLEIESDDLCLRILARRQPVASDLRFIATALKLVTDLERIGDLCVNICERFVELDAPVEPGIIARLEEMGARVGSMVDDALTAFLTRDVAKARRVLDDDGPVDQTYLELFETLIQRMRSNEGAVHDAARLQAIAKYVERIGDHATNVAEMVIYMVESKDIRHPGRLAS